MGGFSAKLQIRLKINAIAKAAWSKADGVGKRETKKQGDSFKLRKCGAKSQLLVAKYAISRRKGKGKKHM